MKLRIPRSVTAFFAVLIAYGLYALAVVPWIEPPLESRGLAVSFDGGLSIHPLRARLESFFPQGHWALGTPKAIEGPQAMLLIERWRQTADGQVELKPCAIVFTVGAEPLGSPEAQAMVLEAPEGALLRFDRPPDLARARLGKFLGGQLAGPVSIRGRLGSDDPQDVLITTHNVRLTPTRIWTDAPVEFRAGPHDGRAKRLEVRLVTTEGAAGKTAAGLGVTGVQWVELKEEVEIHLANLAGTPAEGAGSQPFSVRATCRGPLHFDVVRRALTLDDHVNIHRLRHDGSSDTITCSLLTLELADAAADLLGEPAANPSVDRLLPAEALALPPGIHLKRVLADGDPVRVDSPASAGLVRCQQLQYTVATQSILLKSERQAVLYFGTSEIRAPTFRYQPDSRPGRLPAIDASGPGQFVTHLNDNPRQRIDARWGQRMALERQNDQPLLSLWGSPQVAVSDAGSLTADQLHLYLREADTSSLPPAGSPTAEPDRLLALSSDPKARPVQIDSLPLVGRVGRLEVWFAPSPVATNASSSSADSAATRPADPAATPASSSPPTWQLSGEPASRYRVEGDLLQVEVTGTGRDLSVAHLTVEGAARFTQEPQGAEGKAGLRVEGDWLRVEKANQPQTLVTINGSPATVAASGMKLRAANIYLDRGQNRMWIDTPGEAEATVPASASNQLAGSGPVHIAWQDAMDFDGRTIHFQGDVAVRYATRLLRSRSLDARLSQSVVFGQSADARQITVEEVHCPDAVQLVGRVWEGQRLIAVEQMESRNLLFNQTTGSISGDGPGSVTTVRLRESGAPGSIFPGASVPSRPLAAEPASPELNYLRVDFDRGLEGNQRERRIAFVGRVRSTYGPVEQWNDVIDADSPNGLGEQGMLLATDRLTVTEMRPVLSSPGWLELEALGNTAAEGRSFFARAQRMTYDASKKLVMLEGQGAADAHLWRQLQPGGPPQELAARKIQYWQTDGRVLVDSYKVLNLSQAVEP